MCSGRPISAHIPYLHSCHKFPTYSNSPLSLLVKFSLDMYLFDVDMFLGISWDKEFQAQDLQLASTVSTIAQGEEKAHQSHGEADDLARTAGYLLDAVKHEQNPKFQNSQFLGLMQQLRDRELVVAGNEIVESREKTADVKGKGRAVESVPITATNTARIATAVPRGMAVTQQEQSQQVSTDEQKTEEDANDAYFRQENEDFIHFWNQDRVSNADDSLQASTAETMFWDKLQEDWDNFEATATGIRAVEGYQFLPNNPYLVGDSSTTRHHLMHSGSSRISSSEVCHRDTVQTLPRLLTSP